MNTSIVKAKFKRNANKLKHTFLWELAPGDIKNKILNKMDADEEPLIIFSDPSEDALWCLTNKRIFVSNTYNFFYINDLIKVDFLDIKNNPNNKINSTELALFTEKEIINLIVERNSWHILFNLFQFIIANKNND